MRLEVQRTLGMEVINNNLEELIALPSTSPKGPGDSW